MTVAEIKEYAQTIAEYIKNYREVCREENTNEELIPTTPLQNDIEHLVSMLDELEQPIEIDTKKYFEQIDKLIDKEMTQYLKDQMKKALKKEIEKGE